MSEFTVYLKNLIDKSGQSISAIAQNCGIERTSIHKALSGKRTLPYPAIRKLAACFELSIEEREKFFELYDLSLQGQEAYQNRQAMRDLLNSLSSVNFHMPPLPQISDSPVPDGFVRGEYAVGSTIRAALFSSVTNSDSPEIFAYLPRKMDLTESLMRFWINGKTFSYTELLYMKAGDEHAAENLSLLKRIIPLSLISKTAYRPYYFFKTAESASLSPLSYYIILPDCLILASEDLSLALVTHDKDLWSVYRTFFHRLLESCELLTSTNENLLKIMQSFNDFDSKKEFEIIAAQPCLARYYTPDLVQKYLRSEIASVSADVIPLLNRHFSTLRDISGNFWTVFSEKGLQQIVDTCTISELPPEYTAPLEPADIQNMLRNFRNEIANGRVKGLLVRPSLLDLPDYFEINGSFENGLHLTTENDFIYGAYSCDLQINNPSVNRMFLQFVETLPGSPLVYTKEETLDILDDYIDALNSRSE